MKTIPLIFFLAIALMQYIMAQEKNLQWKENIQVVLDNTTPLHYERGERLPLYLWPAMDPGQLDDKSAEILVKELNERGVGLICSWRADDRDKALSQCLPIARAQKKLGLYVNIDATSLLYSFFNGDIHTAHTDENGNPFFDDSFGPHKMGCPFAIDFRKKEIRGRIDFYIRKYKESDLPVNFIFTDWEIDGPLEVNHAYDASKRCTRCCSHLGNDFDFIKFQKTMREMRSYLQYYAYAEPVLSIYPEALVGNYAVYPNNGYRYWYDYFEYYVEGQPFKADQQAKYRKWYNDFPATGFTYAMPVVYTWAPTYTWYDFANSDYRWFYNMLLVASNAGMSTPSNIPIISFVHWHTIFASGQPDPEIIQMSEKSYQELLWHMLLRGTDTFFMWSGKEEYQKEVQLLYEVYAASLQYNDFIEKGMPVTFDVPKQPGTVISGMVLKDQVLVRRTDFDTNHEPVQLRVGTKIVSVEYAPGVCRIIDLD
jgi:hypothetical protein